MKMTVLCTSMTVLFHHLCQCYVDRKFVFVLAISVCLPNTRFDIVCCVLLQGYTVNSVNHHYRVLVVASEVLFLVGFGLCL